MSDVRQSSGHRGQSPAASNTPPTQNRSWAKPIRILAIVLIFALLAYWAAAWRAKDAIDGTYGKRSGILGAKSVNGTAVLANLFQQRGSRVRTWKRLSPRLNRADTIVWFPDNFEPPTVEQRQWFEDWLGDGHGRTLIYVGRDYDAVIDYWETIQQNAPAEQTVEIERRIATTMANADAQRITEFASSDAGWFTVERSSPRRNVNHLSGPWSKQIDASKVDIQLGSTFVPAKPKDGAFKVQKLLTAPRHETSNRDFDTLVMRIIPENDWDNKVIVVTNGSFLVNFGLVNHEHRKLAAKLIDECDGGEDVVFLESNRWGPVIVDKEPPARSPGALDMMTVWPLSAIVTHVVALGIILCFSMYPIFGHPQRLPEPARADFAKHIQALGSLLAKTGNRVYAHQRIQYYENRVRSDSGVSHRKVTKEPSEADVSDPSALTQPGSTSNIFESPEISQQESLQRRGGNAV